ncbi:MAG: relaxase/mobilization nuclease domain-containing protein [Clostridia bacterium]|nr:relaxase/mobilization nuclease domain-containing protein [Clostridia bacterium]
MAIQQEKACKGNALENIKYIIDKNKTVDENGVRWVDTHNMLSNGSESAAEMHKEFLDVNSFWNKNKNYNERKYYHVIINFKGSKGVTPEKVMNFGRDYLERFYPDQQAVFAAHIDKDDIHFHGCVNSINIETGKKVHRTSKELADRKDFVNELCKKYGIEEFDWRAARDEKRKRQREEVISKNEKELSSAEVNMRRRQTEEELKVTSWKEMMRSAIANAAMHTTNRQAFAEYLKTIYDIDVTRNTENTISFQCNFNGKTRNVRGGTLGELYTAKSIDFWLQYNSKKSTSAEMYRNDPVVPTYKYVVKNDFEHRPNPYKRIGLYDENGRRRTTLELLFILARETVRAYHPSDPKMPEHLKRYRVDWKIQNFIDSMEYCTVNGFKNYADLQRRQESTHSELIGARRQERSLKATVTKMDRINKLIESVNTGELADEELKKATAELHRKNIHDAADIEEFLKRYADTQNHLANVTENVKALWSEEKKIEKAIYNIDYAQSSQYCFGRDFGIHSKLDIKNLYKQMEKEKPQGLENLLTNAYERAGSFGRDEYETKLKQENEKSTL